MFKVLEKVLSVKLDKLSRQSSTIKDVDEKMLMNRYNIKCLQQILGIYIPKYFHQNT